MNIADMKPYQIVKLKECKIKSLETIKSRVEAVKSLFPKQKWEFEIRNAISSSSIPYYMKQFKKTVRDYVEVNGVTINTNIKM